MTDLIYSERAFRSYDHQEKRRRGVSFTIDCDGVWYVHDGHHPGPIERKALAALFGGAGRGFMAGKGLRRTDDGVYVLSGPEENYRVEVEDAPFVIQRYAVNDPGPAQTIAVTTNFDETVVLGPEHRLESRDDGAALYVMVREGLTARLSRPVHHDFLTVLLEQRGGFYVVRSSGVDFRVGIA